MPDIILNTYPTATAWLALLTEIAFQKNASDIHIDPYENWSRIRLRIDGVLREQEKVSLPLHHDGIGRIKILAQLRTDEHMAPQDGRFRAAVSTSANIDIRVSIVPSYFGESAVLRLLRDTAQAPTTADLGMSQAHQQEISKALSRSSGMILVTGPTGSGKTTTLYTLLRMLNDTKRSIITIEDPIEYAIPGIRQIQTNYARHLTFASGLRAIVRQDPDVIMVGEIRDSETAHIAVHTALTGHLLLSTLHTTDAATAIPRLIDLGIEPYLISSTLNVIISQRLVRRKCSHCIKGCDACDQQGYHGRIGVYEMLVPDENISSAILKRSSAQVLKSLAYENGMKTLEDDGLEKVGQGHTSLEEILTAINK